LIIFCNGLKYTDSLSGNRNGAENLGRESNDLSPRAPLWSNNGKGKMVRGKFLYLVFAIISALYLGRKFGKRREIGEVTEGGLKDSTGEKSLSTPI